MARTFALFASAIVVVWLAPIGVEVSAQQPKILPREINPQLLPRVKQSTVFIKVFNEQELGSGSGFLAFEAGIVITNAHVIGMLEKNTKPPTKIEVYINSGETNEVQLPGTVLAVDRAADLAVLRIDPKMLPAPLYLDLQQNLYETQKLYVSGFPLGEALGKNVTISESSVSALRKDSTGSLQKIQVNGGMQPGNSGGPVINSLGQVAGVSVSIIRGTQINFAIPISKVQALMQGKLDEVKAGEIFRQGDEVRVPLKCICLDPLKKIREVRVDVWAGKPGDKYPVSPKLPPALPKDANKQTHKMNYENDVASLDVVLPKLADGQVAWVQPVVSFGKEARWGIPQAFDTTLAVERVPAELTVKHTDQLRSVHLKTTWIISQGKERLSTRAAELDVMESLRADPRGAIVNTALSSLTFAERTLEMEKTHPEAADTVMKVAPVYLVDSTNRLRRKAHRPLDRKLSIDQEDDFGAWFMLVALGYESASLILPNKQMEPNTTWQANSPLELIAVGQQDIGPEMVITYTYEGIRQIGGKREALISFDGRVKAATRSSRRKEVIDWGPVSGKFTFDLTQGFVSSVKMTIAPDIAIVDMAIEVDLMRIQGNPKMLEAPTANETLERQLRVFALADLQGLMKNLATLKVEEARFISVKDGMDNGKKIFGVVPDWLKERTFHFKDATVGVTQFTTESDGIVVMAVSPRYRMGKSLAAPNAGAFGGVREPWYWECASKVELTRNGWFECGAVPILGSNWPMYYRECKKGETFKVRTEKDWAPIVFK